MLEGKKRKKVNTTELFSQKKGKIKKMQSTELHQRMREILTVPQNKY